MNSNYTVWTCDRCGSETQTNKQEQPQDWARVDVGIPPRTSEPDPFGELCAYCHADLITWWRAAKSPSPNTALLEATAQSDAAARERFQGVGSFQTMDDPYRHGRR